MKIGNIYRVKRTIEITHSKTGNDIYGVDDEIEVGTIVMLVGIDSSELVQKRCYGDKVAKYQLLAGAVLGWACLWAEDSVVAQCRSNGGPATFSFFFEEVTAQTEEEQ